MSHTPGPWEMFYKVNLKGFDCYAIGKKQEGLDWHFTWCTFKDDAKLIAAAPEMLAALRLAKVALESIQWYEIKSDEYYAICAIKNVLDKIESNG